MTSADSPGSASSAAQPSSTGLPLLGRISPEDVKSLLRAARPVRFQTRQVLFQRGDPPEGLYIIVAGTVRVVIQDADGTDVTLAKIGMGDLLGELSVLDNTPRSATAVAMNDVEALYVTAEQFRTWLTAHADATWQLLAAMAERLRATDEQLAEIALLRIETRIARRLHQLFSDAGEGRLQPGCRTKLNQVELASTLGATRESINRQLGKLRAAGVLDRDGSDLILLDPTALEEAAEAF